MLRSEAARYARWSAAVALLLASITAIVYVNRGWTRHLERKKAPPPAPVDVTRLSNGITFKKFDEQNRTIFEVKASKSTEFKGQDASLLEDVMITIFGKTGERHDIIHTQSCKYGVKDGGIECSGDVQFDLMSAADFQRTVNDPAQAKALATHVETRGVTFDRGSGVARTDQRVIFAFPNGSGDATGMLYNSEEGALRLSRDVRLRLIQLLPAKADKNGDKKDKNKVSPTPPGVGQEVHVRGRSLDFGRDTRLMHLQGPAEAETQTERLTAGEISVMLDEQFRAQTLVAVAGAGGSQPELTSKGTTDEMQLQADTLTAHFSPQGWATKLDAAGSVRGVRSGAGEDDEAKSDSGTLDLWPRFGQPKELNLAGHVALTAQLKKTGESRALQTTAFRMEFIGGKEHEPSKLQQAETLAAGTMEWTDAAPAGTQAARTKLQADKLVMAFGNQGKAKQLQATGNVQTQRWVAGHPVQTATARSGVAQMSASGGWSQMDLHGDVRLKEGERNGQAEHATFVRASQTATLTGKAVAREATTETHAPRITFEQNTGDILAEDGVRSTDFSTRGSSVQLAPLPANITADTLQANSNTGRALYTGHARLWQGDSVLEANSIELLRPTRVLNAVGNVRGVFPQAPGQLGGLAPRAGSDATAKEVKVAQGSLKKPQLWHVTCGALTYYDTEARAHLQQNVVVQSAEQKMRGPLLDLYFTRAPDAAASGTNVSTGVANSAGGGQQISRALGTGGVIVEEGDRRATAERGEYTAATGQFVMSGGNPTLYDGSAGTTTGRQLTFFLADDTIIVDSENGSRTLTRHRVEK
jgi:lipopolysaccharide export system protein LptA